MPDEAGSGAEPGAGDELVRLRAENDALRAKLALPGAPVKAQSREEVLAGPHHWRWEGQGLLFVGARACPNGEAGVYPAGSVVPEEFALEQIADGGAAGLCMVPFEGEEEPDEIRPLNSAHSKLPRERTHLRPVTVPTGGSA